MAPVDREQSRIYLITRVVLIYLFTVLALITMIIHLDLKLYSDKLNLLPNDILKLVWAVYYVGPVVLAVIYGILFRPFLRGFRNALITLIIIQLVYSFAVFSIRNEIVSQLINKGRWSKHDLLNPHQFKFRYVDVNTDGFKDQVQIQCGFDLSKIRPGHYLLQSRIVYLNDQAQFKNNAPLQIVGGKDFIVATRGEQNRWVEQFVVSLPTMYANPLGRDLDFKVQFVLSRIVNADEDAKKILQFSRWAPFFRTTDWEGGDQDFTGEWTVVDIRTAPDVISLRALPTE